MPYKSNSTNKQSGSNTGDPSAMGQPKAGIQDANIDNINEDIENRYTDDVDEPTIDTRRGSHPNRNTNKPHIDKPRYS